MPNETLRQIDIASQEVRDMLLMDVGENRFAQAVTFVDEDGNLLGAAVVVRPTTVVDTAAYVDGDCVGGIISIANFFTSGGGKAEITGMEITELGGQKPPILFSFYRATPAGGTYTDNAALALDASDVADRTGTPIIVVAGDYSALGGHQSAGLLFPPMTVEGNSSTLFMLMQAKGAYDAVAGSDLVIRINARRVA